MVFGVDGRVFVYRIENDGSMTETERLFYDDSEGSVTTTTQGDITASIQSAGYSIAALGNGLINSVVSDIDGQPTLLLTSTNNGSVTAWTIGKDGSLQFNGGITEFGSPSASVRDGVVGNNVVYEGDDGTEYVYVCRPDADRIDIFTYDPSTGAMTLVGSSASLDSISDLAVTNVDGNTYLASINDNTISIYSVNSLDGSLSLLANESVTIATSGTRSATVEFYHTSDGRTYLIASGSYTDVAFMYEVASDGTLTLSDSMTDRGAYITTVSYIDDEPVFLAVNDSGGIDIFTISQSGEFVLQTTVAGSYDSKSNPSIVQTPDGSYYLILGDGDVSSVKLDIGISSRLTTSGTLTISDVDQDDSLHLPTQR